MAGDAPQVRSALAVFAIPWFAATALLLAAPALADQVFLTNGRVLEGRARALPAGDSEGEIEIASAMGVLRIPSRLVERIERSDTLEQQLEALAAKAGHTADSLFALAIEAESAGARTLARRLFLAVLDLDSDHPRARERLGYRRSAEGWVTLEEERRLRGEVLFRGDWMSVGQRARLLSLEAASQQIAEQRRLESERHARWREAQADQRSARQPTGAAGIPLGYLWSPSTSVAVPPAFVPLPQPMPNRRVTPPSTGPPPAPRVPARPQVVPPRPAATGGFQRGG